MGGRSALARRSRYRTAVTLVLLVSAAVFAVLAAVEIASSGPTVVNVVAIACCVLIGGYLADPLIANRAMLAALARARSMGGDVAPQRSRPSGWTEPGPMRFRTVDIGDLPLLAKGVGSPDRSFLYLWVFDEDVHGRRMSSLPTVELFRKLRRLGNVFVLRGGAVLFDPDHVGELGAILRGRADDLIATTRAEVDERLTAFTPRKRLGGWFDTCSIMCSDAIWTYALERMMERVDAVVVDLWHLTSDRVGISIELGLLLDRVPVERIVMVAAPGTDPGVLERQLRSAWDTLAVDSPNRRDRTVDLVAIRVDKLGTVTDRSSMRTARRAQNEVVLLAGAALHAATAAGLSEPTIDLPDGRPRSTHSRRRRTQR